MQRLALALALCLTACAPGTIFAGAASAFFSTPTRVPNKIQQPRRSDARLAVLWIGHASVLIQIDDKLVLTDPVFTETVGQIGRASCRERV